MIQCREFVLTRFNILKLSVQFFRHRWPWVSKGSLPKERFLSYMASSSRLRMSREPAGGSDWNQRKIFVTDQSGQISVQQAQWD
jgi:hypothetical protein